MTENEKLYDSVPNPKRVEEELEICLMCGKLIPRGSRCTLCGITKEEFDTRFTKFKRSDQGSQIGNTGLDWVALGFNVSYYLNAEKMMGETW